MTTTNADILRGALQLIHVLGATEALRAEHSTVALAVLNDMLTQWRDDGVDLGYDAQVDANAEFPPNPSTHLAVKSNLAVMLAPYFEREPSRVLLATASGTYRTLLREAMVAKMQPADLSHLPRGEGHMAEFDIETG